MSVKNLILGSFLWFLMFIFLSIPILILLIWKCSVILIAKCIRRDLRVLRTGPDVSFCTGPSHIKSIVNVGVVLKIQGEIGLDELQMKFTETFLKNEDNNPEYEKFFCSLVSFGGFIFAKRIQRIEINELIYIRNLKTNELLEDCLSEWLLSKYKVDTPCWEIILVPLKSTNETAIAFKIHHAFTDGYSLLYILDKLMDNTSPYIVKPFDESCGQKVLQMLQAPCHLGKIARDPESNPIPCKEEDSPRWMLGFCRLDLELLKRIRRAHNVQFGSLMLSLVGGALRKHLLAEKKLSPSELPLSTFMAITLPWPKHPSKDPNTQPKERMCNHWVSGLVKVPVQEENPLERLKSTEESLAEFQNIGLHKFFNRFITPLMWLLPTCAVSQMLGNDMGVSAGYSTILGGNDYKLLGKFVTQIHSFLASPDLISSLPMSTFAFSHSHHLEVTIAVNPQNFPDRQVLNRMLNEYLPHEIKRLSILSNIIIHEDN